MCNSPELDCGGRQSDICITTTGAEIVVALSMTGQNIGRNTLLSQGWLPWYVTNSSNSGYRGE
jgi:hypothetical protein